MLDFTVYMRYCVTYILCFYATSKVQNVFPFYELDNKVIIIILCHFITGMHANLLLVWMTVPTVVLTDK